MTTHRCPTWIMILTVTVSTSACAGSPTAGTHDTTIAPKPKPPEKPWAGMSLSERKAHMNEHVVPVMESHFKRHDPARFSSFSCETCHGVDMVARNFKMPNPGLLALHPTGSAEQHNMVDAYPEMVKLMFNHVLPDMQTSLGATPYDPSTKTGFSCYSCHPTADRGEEASL